MKQGHAIGSDASNRYIEQLAHSAPNSANYQVRGNHEGGKEKSFHPHGARGGQVWAWLPVADQRSWFGDFFLVRFPVMAVVTPKKRKVPFAPDHKFLTLSVCCVSSPQAWGEKKKFTLDCVLNPIDAVDDAGKPIKLLQFTQVDDFGAANRAGCSTGEVLVQLNGKNIFSFDDLKACIDDINKNKLTSVSIVVQGMNGQRESTITGAPI